MQDRGYIFLFQDKYADELKTRIKHRKIFKETVPFVVSDKYQTVEFHLISTTGINIDYAALVEQGKRNLDSVVIKSKLSFYDFLEIIEPIKIKDIEQQLQNKLKYSFVLKTIKFNNDTKDIYQYSLYEREWNQLINEIKQQRPGLADNIDEMLIKRTGHSWIGHGFNVMAQQKDAIQLALNLTGIDQNILKYRLPNIINEEKADNFLKFVKNNEDSLINHDLQIFDNWVTKDKDTAPISRTFQQGSQILTVTNVNRNLQYEGSLGVDLIYYHKSFNLFIMIQYKLWQESRSEYFYRADQQYDKDIERMKKACFELFLYNRKINHEFKIKDYRLNSNPFFFKLCHPTQLNYRNEMIHGNYLPFQYLNYYMNQRTGDRGGRIIRQKDLERNLNNELFVSLVKNGLIGSHGITNSSLDEIVTSLVERGENVILATARKAG